MYNFIQKSIVYRHTLAIPMLLRLGQEDLSATGSVQPDVHKKTLSQKQKRRRRKRARKYELAATLELDFLGPQKAWVGLLKVKQDIQAASLFYFLFVPRS